MKALVLYRPGSEHATATESFLRDLNRQRDLGDKLEVVSLDTKEGDSTAKLYDVVEYPGILIIDDFGSVIRSWQGEHFPLMDEVMGYLQD